MANIEEAIRRLKFLYEQHGAETLIAAQKAVADSTTGAERAALSLEKQFNSLERRMVPTVRAQQEYERVQRQVSDALKQNPALQARANAVLENAAKQYQAATQGLTVYNKTITAGTGETRLARHELINLSRQIQDVGVGIASGQGFGTILVQQGTQIADVFATSTGTLRGFFGQAVAGAGAVITSTAGIASGVAAVGAAMVYATSSFASGQRDIVRSLSGIGAASGVTRDQINQIADASSSAFGLSTSEARVAASAFAATGRIYKDNVAAVTSVVHDFAVVTGVDAAEATKQLAAALADPAKGAMDLNKAIGFLDATTLTYITTLQSQGRLQEAQAVLLSAAGPKIKEMGQQVGWLTKAWEGAKNAVSNFITEWEAAHARTYERLTGQEAGGFSDEDRLARNRAKLEELRASKFQGPMAQPQLQAWEAAERKLLEAIDATNKKINERRLDQLGTDALNAARSIMPAIGEIEKLREQLSALQRERAIMGGEVTGPEKVGNVRLVQLEQENAALVRQAEATSRIALMYPGMTIEGAKQLYNLQQQATAAAAVGTAGQLQAQQQASFNMMVAQGVAPLEAIRIATAQTALAQTQINAQAQQQLVAAQGQLSVAQARGGAEKIVAQEQATITQLLAQQVPLETALKIAATERQTAEENVKRAIEGQIKSLEDQVRLSRARQNGTEASVKAEIAYERAIASNSGEALAAQLRDQTLRVERIREAEEAEREVADAVQSTRDAQVAAHNQQIEAINQTRAANNALYAELEDKIGFTITLILSMQDAMTGAFTSQQGFTGWAEIFTKPGGGYSQFDPKGYVSEVPTPVSVPKETPEEAAERMWGSGGFKEIKQLSQFSVMARVGEKYEPTVQGRIFQQQQMIEAGLQMGDTLQDAFRKTLAAPFEESQQLMQQIIALASPTEQTGMLQQAIERAREQPATLANEQLIKQLTDQLKGLTSSTDSLNATLQSALSPYYSQDPRTTKLGFRAGVKGNPDWMTGATNESALDAILGPGAIAPTTGTVTTTTTTTTATSSGSTLTSGAIQLPDEIRYPYNRTGFAAGGSFTVPGGYSATDNKIAQFPVASGERVTVDRKGAQPNVVNIDNRIVIVGGVDENTLGKFKVSRYQQGQRMRASMAG